MNANFKTRVFGGFDREDVISFIEKTSLEHQKRVSALEEENKRLSDRCGAAEAEVQALREQSRAELAAAAELEELKRKFAALTAENEQLRGENEQLRGPAEEYRRMKDHIADIEISAHRRTEEFRAQAIAELPGDDRAAGDVVRAGAGAVSAAQRAVCAEAGAGAPDGLSPRPEQLRADARGSRGALGQLRRAGGSVR